MCFVIFNLYIVGGPSWLHDLPQVLQWQPLLVLVQVGEFYETMGTDAVLLVQHAGLNPMGQGIPPRAGCPIMNLRKTLSDLVVEAGIPTVHFAGQTIASDYQSSYLA